MWRMWPHVSTAHWSQKLGVPRWVPWQDSVHVCQDSKSNVLPPGTVLHSWQHNSEAVLYVPSDHSYSRQNQHISQQWWAWETYNIKADDKYEQQMPHVTSFFIANPIPCFLHVFSHPAANGVRQKKVTTKVTEALEKKWKESDQIWEWSSSSCRSPLWRPDFQWLALPCLTLTSAMKSQDSRADLGRFGIKYAMTSPWIGSDQTYDSVDGVCLWGSRHASPVAAARAEVARANLSSCYQLLIKCKT